MEAPYDGLLIEHIFLFIYRILERRVLKKERYVQKEIVSLCLRFQLPLFMLHQLLVLVYPWIECFQKNSEKQDDARFTSSVTWPILTAFTQPYHLRGC